MKRSTNKNRTYMQAPDNTSSKLSQTIFQSLEFLDVFLPDRRLRRVFSDIVTAAVTVVSVNTSELARAMPRICESYESCYRAINRFLSNERVSVELVMKPLAALFILKVSAMFGRVVFMMDQSKIKDGRECLMISIRFMKRAIPYVWLVVDTKGAIGFRHQKMLLDSFCRMLPEGVNVVFTADRFYGHRKLINYCNQRNWEYRIRMKSDLYIYHNGEFIKTGDILDSHPEGVSGCRLGNHSGVKTSIAAIKDKKHQEAWIIAMDGLASTDKAREYGQRWGIESMFSDLKTRGFNITKTHLMKTDRIERLILICAVAMYFIVSTAMEPTTKQPKHTEKKAQRSKLSMFTEGVRRLRTEILTTGCFYMIWKFLDNLTLA